jgi:hypothetical protein
MYIINNDKIKIRNCFRFTNTCGLLNLDLFYIRKLAWEWYFEKHCPLCSGTLHSAQIYLVSLRCPFRVHSRQFLLGYFFFLFFFVFSLSFIFFFFVSLSHNSRELHQYSDPDLRPHVAPISRISPDTGRCWKAKKAAKPAWAAYLENFKENFKEIHIRETLMFTVISTTNNRNRRRSPFLTNCLAFKKHLMRKNYFDLKFAAFLVFISKESDI